MGVNLRHLFVTLLVKILCAQASQQDIPNTRYRGYRIHGIQDRNTGYRKIQGTGNIGYGEIQRTEQRVQSTEKSRVQGTEYREIQSTRK